MKKKLDIGRENESEINKEKNDKMKEREKCKKSLDYRASGDVIALIKSHYADVFKYLS